MKTRSLDAVLASQPLNATAGRVVAQKGEHYEPPGEFLNPNHSDVPLPIVPLNALDDNQRASLARVIGKQFGRLVVLGILNLPERKSKSGSRYVVRCLCGRYETRRGRALFGPGSVDGEDRCSACWSLRKIQWRFENQGARPLEDFTNRGQRF